MMPYIPAIIILIMAARKYYLLGSNAGIDTGYMIGSLLAWIMVATFWLVGTILLSIPIFAVFVRIGMPYEDWIWDCFWCFMATLLGVTGHCE